MMNAIIIITFFILFIGTLLDAAPVVDFKVSKYMLDFGYLDSYKPSVSKFTASVKRLQSFGNIKVTGVIDDATRELLKTDRCQLSDPKILASGRRRKRFVHQGSKWVQDVLSWKLVNTGRFLRKDDVRVVMRKAFKFWADVMGRISFRELDDNAQDVPEIYIKFVSGYHSDPYAFDGQGGTLAHAFYPHNNKGLSGDVHFDDAEQFTIESPAGRNLLWVATHELGHSLGLEHSNVRAAVMFPWYTKYKPGFSLNEDDIFGIQSLYGAPRDPDPTAITTTRSTTTTTTPKPTPKKIPNTRDCPKSPINSIFFNEQIKYKIVFSEDDSMLMFGESKVLHPFPAKWYVPKVKGPIDAVMNIKLFGKDHIVFFSGTNYYLYSNRFSFVSGPHSIQRKIAPIKFGLPASVRKIDSAMLWKRNGRVYLFADTDYYRFNVNANQMDSGYPKKISVGWKGLPSRVNAAFSSEFEKRTIFIVGVKMYTFDDYYFKVKKVQHIGEGLLDCGGRSSLSTDAGSVEDHNQSPSESDP